MRKRRRSGATRILLLATMPPNDGRPDTVAFHLTRHTHDRMLDMACTAVARLPRAKLSIKLHPRCTDEQAFRQALARHPEVQGEIVQTAALDRLVAQSDCVLSYASTAGIEAALAGAPVVQLLPAGSGDILPAEGWGLLGSAREPRELEVLLDAALLRGWQPPTHNEQVLGEASLNRSRSAAQRIADALLERDFAVAPAAEA
jgi:capsule polysaccharide export protein KpsC/LpsZ